MPNSRVKAVRSSLSSAQCWCAELVVDSVFRVEPGVAVSRLDHFAAVEAGAEVARIAVCEAVGEGRDGF